MIEKGTPQAVESHARLSSAQNFFANRSEDFRPEESPTRSKLLTVLALLMLLLAATALAQAQGSENGTGQIEAGEAGKTNWLERNAIEIGAVVGLLAIIAYLSGFVSWTIKFVQARLGKKPSENSSPPRQILTESRTATASAEKSPGKISNIPHPHNPNFTGRVDLLDKLHEALASGERAAFTQTQAITGLGGVGKTQLALEYSYRHADDYKVVWWVRSEEPATLAADYAGLAGRLDLPEKASQDQRVTVEAVRRWLEQNGGWLLVFDNAQNFKDLQDYLPRAGSGHVIITSRNQSYGGVARMLTVDIFTPTESVEFLGRRTGQDDEDTAKALAEALGNLPLALEQAGAYIQETGISLSAYLKLFQERHEELLSRGKPDAYPDTVATTWDLSFQKASEEVPASADLLNLCAFLAPDDIPKSLLNNGAEHLPEPLASTVTDEMALNDAVAALKRYSLMTVADDSFSVHRLVQAVARDRLSEKEKKRWAGAAVRIVSGAFPYQSDDIRTWDECSALLPHALAAAGHAEKLEVAPEANCRLLNHVGLYLGEQAEYDAAKSVYERSLTIGERVYGPDHPNMAIWFNNLGSVLKDLSDLASAKKNYERALEIDEKIYGPDHPNVASDVNNLGEVLRALGDLAGAKELLERALVIGGKTLGPDHPKVAIFFNNLGGVLDDLGDLAAAKNNYERALEIEEKVYGPDHPNVATDINNLGLVMRALGDLAGAKKSYDRALEIDEKVYGPDHPNVARDFNNLGLVLKDLGNLVDAKSAFERALEIDEKVYGPDHHQVATNFSNLGFVLKDLGDLAGAKSAFERALEIDEKVYGPDHHQVATDVNNLGFILKDLGNLADAKFAFGRALEIDEKVYGPDHPEVAINVNNLGAVLRALGDMAGAKFAFERALEIEEKVYGPDHPEVAINTNNLGSVLQTMGDFEGAKEHYEQALDICRNSLGEDHPTTKLVRENLESLCR